MYLFIEYPNIGYTCMPFSYVDMHLKTILAVCLVFTFYEVHTTPTAYDTVADLGGFIGCN